MALRMREAASDKEARELIELGKAEVALVGDVLPSQSEGSDQFFCRVFAAGDVLTAIRHRMNWDHPPDRALGDDFVVAWDLGEDEVRTALRQEFGG